MTDNQTPPPTATAYPPIEYVIAERKRNPLRRAGCIFALAIWFTVLLLPLCLFILAAQQEITISHFGDVPDKFQHPLFQVQLVMERNYRGLRLVNTTTASQSDDNICVQTNVRYILWEGTGEPATFCRCYERDATESTWTLLEQTLEACK